MVMHPFGWAMKLLMYSQPSPKKVATQVCRAVNEVTSTICSCLSLTLMRQNTSAILSHQPPLVTLVFCLLQRIALNTNLYIYIYLCKSVKYTDMHVSGHVDAEVWGTGGEGHLLCHTYDCNNPYLLWTGKKADGDGVNWHFKHAVLH